MNRPWLKITTRQDSRSCMIVVRGFCGAAEGPTSHGKVLRTREDAIAELGAGKASFD
jgi:hypothetical protein